MKIIKLSAIDSTSDFLKKMAENSVLEDFTTVIAEKQTAGRGQMHNSWQVEAGKNLTFSVFIRGLGLGLSNQRHLSFAVAISVFETLKGLDLPKLAIKWPNDIMAADKKIGGILVENNIHKGKIDTSVIGIGINVNQINFDNLPQASSIKVLLNEDTNVEEVFHFLLRKLQINIGKLKKQDFKGIEKMYLQNLYRINVPSMFKDKNKVLFMGKIIGVSQEGKLQLELIDETIKEYDLKEVSLVY